MPFIMANRLGRIFHSTRMPFAVVKNICRKPTEESRTTTDGVANESILSNKLLPYQLELIDSHKICVLNVKKYDRENYLAALCIKDNLLKRVVFALRAFNVELSLIRDSTTNSDRAKVRFHFWSKLIDEIIRRNSQGDPNLEKAAAYYKHAPVAKELLDLFYLVDVDSEIQQYLKDLIGARLSSKVLGYKQFENMSELELYCYKSNSSLYHLCWRLDMQLHNVWHTNYEIIPTVKSIADNLGTAQGISNLIRGIPYNATKNCCYIPKDLLDQHQLTNRDFVGSNLDGDKIKPIVKLLAIKCQQLVDQVYSDNRFIPNHFRQLFLPRVALQSNLNRLKRYDYNICARELKKRNEFLPLNLKLASLYFRAPIF